VLQSTWLCIASLIHTKVHTQVCVYLCYRHTVMCHTHLYHSDTVHGGVYICHPHLYPSDIVQEGLQFSPTLIPEWHSTSGYTIVTHTFTPVTQYKRVYSIQLSPALIPPWHSTSGSTIALVWLHRPSHHLHSYLFQFAVTKSILLNVDITDNKPLFNERFLFKRTACIQTVELYIA